MPGFDANFAASASTIQTVLGEPATLTPPGGSAIPLMAIIDRTTTISGELGAVVDSRPSANLLLADVGLFRSGVLTLTATGESWQLVRPIDGGQDAYSVRIWLQPIAAVVPSP